jgi:ribosomal protein L11 methyltransferase
LIAELADDGYESFEETEYGVNAYIPDCDFNETTLQELIRQVELLIGNIDISHLLYKDKNWNEYWERNFSPVTINNEVFIGAPFHIPPTGIPYKIWLEPKMSFGTGHHPSTWLMVEKMITMPFEQKSVFDVGCGTGVLAILASLKNATEVWAVDNNEWAYMNALGNLRLNKCNNINILAGDYQVVLQKKFDIIMANINRNVLLNEIKEYVQLMKCNACLLLSGILTVDETMIIQETTRCGLTVDEVIHKDGWSLIVAVNTLKSA